MSEVKVNKLSPRSGTTVTLGDSGDTITLPAGVTLANSGTFTNFQSTGIDDNAASTAITIDSGQRVRINNTTSTGHGTTYNLIVGNESSGADAGVLVVTPNNENAYFGFGDDGGVPCSLNYNHASNFLRTYVNGSERMRIDSSGLVGIGTTSAQAKVHVMNNDASALIDGNADELFLENTTSTGLTIGSSNTGECAIHFSDSDDSDAGKIQYTHSDNLMTFRTNGGNRMYIDSSGHAIIPAGVTLGTAGTYSASNTLDDYEEGTFQPTLTPSTSGSITISTTQDELKYTKIGSTVFIQGRLTIQTISAPVGVSVILGNMPFAPAAYSEGSGWFGGMCAISFNGSSTFEPYTVWTTDGTVKITTATASINSNTRIHFNFFYYTTA